MDETDDAGGGEAAEPANPDDAEAWAQQLRRDRERKDEFLAEHPQSPIPSTAREEFDGLDYFPPDPDLRFEVPLAEHDDPEAVTIETTTGGEQEYRRTGEFTVQIDGTAVTLQAYRSDPEEDRLWVPFRDETNGEATYGGGRYLDLEAPADRVGDRWVLDFNRAYSPHCAYNDHYECPLVPMENWLDVRVEAGEQVVDLPTAEHEP